MTKLHFLLIILIFLAGFITAEIVNYIPIASAITQNDLPEQISPQNHISESQIAVYTDKVVLDIPDVKWATFSDTNSMDPFFDTGAYALQIVPNSPSDIAVGDVVSYSLSESPKLHIIHRVVHIGEDSQGLYYILKGDNVRVSDPGKVRFEQIDRVLIGVLY